MILIRLIIFLIAVALIFCALPFILIYAYFNQAVVLFKMVVLSTRATVTNETTQLTEQIGKDVEVKDSVGVSYDQDSEFIAWNGKAEHC